MFLLTTSFYLYAHEGEKHHKKDTTEQKEVIPSAKIASQHAHTESIQSVDEFPNLHPLVVHFPIVLLIVAAIMQLIGIFLLNRPYHIATTVLLILGFISGYLASSVFHAHTGDLPAGIAELFEDHEKWAFYAVRLSGVATIFKITSLFLKPRKWLEGLVAVILLAAAVSVAIAGHHGSELVHKYDIGPKGNYLESHH